MMDAIEVAAALRRAAEKAGCGTHAVASGSGYCPDGSCSECVERSRAWFSEAADAIERSAMPEGVEWPRFEDGDYVKIGDFIVSPESGERRKVDCINFFDNAWYIGLVGASSERLDRCDRVKRPHVLAADGEPLEVGQTVYGTRDLEPVEIVSLSSKEYDGVRTVKCKDRTCFVFYAPDDLIHQLPALDADGVPIKVGDTVWDVENGFEFEVSRVDGCAVTMSNGAYYSRMFTRYCTTKLTHTKPEPPDTWERIEEDATLSPREYYARYVGHDVGLKDDEEVNGAFGNSLVRRCKALAEKESHNER